jgi:membrane associated rhomboid family serine protease
VFPLKDNIATQRVPIVTIALILANVVVYLLSIRHGGTLWSGPDDHEVIRYGAIPYEFSHWGQHCIDARAGTVIECGRHVDPGQPTTLETAFSSMFMHGGALHIGGNMLFLWIFGANVEDAMGRVRYVVFYVLGGVAALGGQILVGSNDVAPLIGASGAIAGVMAGYLIVFPRARVLSIVLLPFFFTLIEIPALWFLGIWFAEQLVFGLAGLTNPTGGGGGVAYFAHVGGFAFGLLFVKLFARRRAPPQPPRPALAT